MSNSTKSKRNFRQKNESEQHRQMKQAVVELYKSLDWYVFIERGRTDVLVCKCRDGRLLKLGVEPDRTPRNVVQNAVRNFANGCDILLFVVLTESARRAIRRKINVNFAPEVSRKVAITTLHAIQQFGNRARKNSSAVADANTSPPAQRKDPV